MEGDERKNESYWSIGTHLEFGMYDYEYSNFDSHTETEDFFDGLDTLLVDYSTEYTELDDVSREGDDWEFNYKLNAKLNYKLDKNIYLGMGAFFNYSYSDRTYETVDEFESVETYELIDDIIDENDMQTTIAYLIKSDDERETSRTSIVLPVGLEYKLDKHNKWSTRFGAIFVNTSTIENYKTEITEAAPVITTTEYGDGSVDVEIADNTYESFSMQEKSSYSNTNYYYGLGFEPSDKMQIDFIGIFNTDYGTLQDFIQGIRMSFTFKF
jgi:hypothetical protein